MVPRRPRPCKLGPSQYQRSHALQSSICRYSPFPPPGRPRARASGRTGLRPAVESLPEAARTRPIGPRDRGSIRKVALSELRARFGRGRPSRRDGGSLPHTAYQAHGAGEPWHQFVGSGCHAGHDVLSYGRTPVESARSDGSEHRGPVGSNVLSISESQAPDADRRGVDLEMGKSRATRIFASERAQASY